MKCGSIASLASLHEFFTPKVESIVAAVVGGKQFVLLMRFTWYCSCCYKVDSRNDRSAIKDDFIFLSVIS
jgi:hypothetical protein